MTIRCAPQFCGYSQQDCQEFLRYLIDGVHEVGLFFLSLLMNKDLKTVHKLPEKPDAYVRHGLFPGHCSCGRDDKHPSHSSKAAFEQYRSKNDSFMMRTFAGQLRSTVRCCGLFSVSLVPSLVQHAATSRLCLSPSGICLWRFPRRRLLSYFRC